MIKYTILNKLFGWDYVAWKNNADSGIARVRNDGIGRTYYIRYKITKVIDIVSDPEKVIWLTCKPEKYGFERVGK